MVCIGAVQLCFMLVCLCEMQGTIFGYYFPRGEHGRRYRVVACLMIKNKNRAILVYGKWTCVQACIRAFSLNNT